MMSTFFMFILAIFVRLLVMVRQNQRRQMMEQRLVAYKNELKHSAIHGLEEAHLISIRFPLVTTAFGKCFIYDNQTGELIMEVEQGDIIRLDSRKYQSLSLKCQSHLLLLEVTIYPESGAQYDMKIVNPESSKRRLVVQKVSEFCDGDNIS